MSEPVKLNKRITARVSRAAHKSVRLAAARLDMKESDFVREAVREKIERAKDVEPEKE